MTKGDVSLLKDTAARQLLGTARPAHLAYTWLHGMPRCAPIGFYANARRNRDSRS